MITILIRNSDLGKKRRVNIPRLDTIIQFQMGAKVKMPGFSDQDASVEMFFLRIGEKEYRQLNSVEISKLFLWLKKNPEVNPKEMTISEAEEAIK